MKSKDTEVGRIPVDWEVRQVSEIGEVIAGGTPRTKVDEYWNGEIAWITPKDLSGYNNKYIYKGERSITKIGLENSSARLLPKGTVLFSSRAPIGYVAIAGKDMATNQGFKSIVCDKSIANNIFIYYLMKYKKEEIENIAGGSTFKEVSGKVINQFNVQIPPLTEQKAIADTLSSLDDKIELNNKINENLEQQAQAIFKHWFIDFEFPDENGNPYRSSGGQMVESELGMIPKGWERVEFGDIISIYNGKRPKVKVDTSDKDNRYPILGASGTMGYTNDFLYNEPILVIGRVGTHGVVQKVNKKAWTSDNTMVIKSTYYEFVNQVLLNLDYKSLNRGSTQPLLVQKDIKNQKIVIPSKNKKILELYESTINEFRKQTNIFQDQNQILSQLRGTLLPKLMSGDIRILPEDNGGE